MKVQKMLSNKPLILLTNDDGIDSPGIHAAARALAPLGELVLVAPRDQASATGRSHPLTSDGTITKVPCCLGTMNIDAYAIGGTPAQCVARAIIQVLPRLPDLVVSGINYGENFGIGITVSGTVGAALEAAAFGIPSLAASLQLLDIDDFDKFNPEINFDAAAFFTHKFAAFMLEKRLTAPVDLLKIEIPALATPETDWRMTRLARHNYYEPLPDQTIGWDKPNKIAYRINISPDDTPADSDIHTVVYDQMVSVTPLTIDLTAPVDLVEWEQKYRNNGLGK
jgi:5'-nucleotidase